VVRRREEALVNATGIRVLQSIVAAVPVWLMKRDLLFVAEQLLRLLDEKRLEMVARNPSDEGMVRAQARWDAIMDKMIAAFEASERMSDGIYEAELGDYPMGRPSGVSIDAWEAVKKSRFAAIRLLTERDQKIFEEGMALFVTHYHSLWD